MMRRLALMLAVCCAALPAAAQPRTAPARRGDLVRTVTARGRWVYEHDLVLVAAATGTLVEVSVAAGDRVERGAMLVRFDDAEARLDLRQAELGLALARLRLQQAQSVLESRVAAARQTLERARARAAEADERSAAAARTLERATRLHEAGQLSEEQKAAAAQAQRAAEAAALEARSAAAAAERALADPSQQLEVEVRSTELHLAELPLERARLALERLQLRAPWSGTVWSLALQPGQHVPAGASLLRLVDDSRGWILAELPPDQTTQVRPGQRAELRRAGGAYEARVRSIDPSGPRCRVDVEAPAQATAIEPLELRIEVERVAGAVLIPLQALRSTADGRWTVRVLQGGSEVERQVEVALTANGLAAIASGLAEGELVVLPDASDR